MAIETLGGGGFDYVQNTAPSGPDIGDSWLDTSTDPPQGKVYADLGGGGQWTKIDVVERIATNVDTKVSSRSSHDDPDPNGYIDSPISESGLPTGAYAWRWNEFTIANSLPAEVGTQVSGGSISKFSQAFELSSGSSSGNYAMVEVGGARDNFEFTGGRLIFGTYAALRGTYGGREAIFFGENGSFGTGSTASNAGFDATNNTVYVTDDGSQTTSTVTCPHLEPTYYEVEIDFNNTETNFYVGGSALTGSTPDATISNTPSASGNYNDLAGGVSAYNDGNRAQVAVFKVRTVIA